MQFRAHSCIRMRNARKVALVTYLHTCIVAFFNSFRESQNFLESQNFEIWCHIDMTFFVISEVTVCISQKMIK